MPQTRKYHFHVLRQWEHHLLFHCTSTFSTTKDLQISVNSPFLGHWTSIFFNYFRSSRPRRNFKIIRFVNAITKPVSDILKAASSRRFPSPRFGKYLSLPQFGKYYAKTGRARHASRISHPPLSPAWSRPGIICKHGSNIRAREKRTRRRRRNKKKKRERKRESARTASGQRRNIRINYRSGSGDGRLTGGSVVSSPQSRWRRKRDRSRN